MDKVPKSSMYYILKANSIRCKEGKSKVNIIQNWRKIKQLREKFIIEH